MLIGFGCLRIWIAGDSVCGLFLGLLGYVNSVVIVWSFVCVVCYVWLCGLWLGLVFMVGLGLSFGEFSCLLMFCGYALVAVIYLLWLLVFVVCLLVVFLFAGGLDCCGIASINSVVVCVYAPSIA